MPEKEIGRPGGSVRKRSLCDQAAQRSERFVKRGMRYLGTWIAIPAAIRPLPLRESGSQFANARIAAKAGLTPDDYQLTIVPYPEMIGALANKALDAAYHIEPSIAIAEGQGVARPVAAPVGQ